MLRFKKLISIIAERRLSREESDGGITKRKIFHYHFLEVLPIVVTKWVIFEVNWGQQKRRGQKMRLVISLKI